MKIRMRRAMFGLARSSAAGALVRFGFVRLEPLLSATVLTPVARGERCAVYQHPVPAYGSWHQIGVPLVAVPDVIALAHPRHLRLRTSLIALIEQVADLDASVLVNAGPRQDVGQVHFHLTDDPMSGFGPARTRWSDWETAVCGMAVTPDLADRQRAGFSLLRRSGRTEIELV